uniref:Putative secreted protein n=1 Tax=Anopheles darlingi TaxID=43151 RepID=A0A2M4DHD9_ANODA
MASRYRMLLVLLRLVLELPLPLPRSVETRPITPTNTAVTVTHIVLAAVVAASATATVRVVISTVSIRSILSHPVVSVIAAAEAVKPSTTTAAARAMPTRQRMPLLMLRVEYVVALQEEMLATTVAC